MSEWLASLRTTNRIWLPPSVGRVVAHQVGDVDARDRGGRDRPRRRDAPVAAVDQTGRGVVWQAGWVWGSVAVGLMPGLDDAGAVAPVVAEAEDVDVVVGRRRLDLERLRLADVDADLRRVALDRASPTPLDLPVAGRVAGQGVLARDRVGHRRRTRARGRRGADAAGTTTAAHSRTARNSERFHQALRMAAAPLISQVASQVAHPSRGGPTENIEACQAVAVPPCARPVPTHWAIPVNGRSVVELSSKFLIRVQIAFRDGCGRVFPRGLADASNVGGPPFLRYGIARVDGG